MASISYEQRRLSQYLILPSKSNLNFMMGLGILNAGIQTTF